MILKSCMAKPSCLSLDGGRFLTSQVTLKGRGSRSSLILENKIHVPAHRTGVLIHHLTMKVQGPRSKWMLNNLKDHV